MNSLPRIIASLIIFALLAGCGLKGPLYLPKPESAPASPAKAPANKPKPPAPPAQ